MKTGKKGFNKLILSALCLLAFGYGLYGYAEPDPEPVMETALSVDKGEEHKAEVTIDEKSVDSLDNLLQPDVKVLIINGEIHSSATATAIMAHLVGRPDITVRTSFACNTQLEVQDAFRMLRERNDEVRRLYEELGQNGDYAAFARAVVTGAIPFAGRTIAQVTRVQEVMQQSKKLAEEIPEPHWGRRISCPGCRGRC